MSRLRRAPWLDLLTPLTEKILERLPLSDYIRFAAVCRRWRSIQADHRRLHAPSPPPMLNLPWFLSWLSDEDETVLYWSPFEGRSYRIRVPDGSAWFPKGGWILRPDAALNPISGIKIQFPEDVDEDDVEFVVVSLSPDRVVFLITALKPEVFIYRSGDRRWTQMQLHLGVLRVSNALALGGKLYCLFDEEEEEEEEEEDVEGVVTMTDHLVVIDPLPTPPTMDSLPMGATGRGPCFLVESGRDVLLVRVIREGNWPLKTVGFRMFKANVSEKTWTRVEGLGDRSLILHSKSLESVSLLAADVGLRANCIYFLIDVIDEGAESGDLLWRRFDFDSGTVTEVPFPNGSMVEDSSNIDMPTIC